MGFKIVRYKISKKKKINIPSGALFTIPAKHLAVSDLVQSWLLLSDRSVSSSRYFWMSGIVNQKLNTIHNNIYTRCRLIHFFGVTCVKPLMYVTFQKKKNYGYSRQIYRHKNRERLNIYMYTSIFRTYTLIFKYI